LLDLSGREEKRREKSNGSLRFVRLLELCKVLLDGLWSGGCAEFVGEVLRRGFVVDFDGAGGGGDDDVE